MTAKAAKKPTAKLPKRMPEGREVVGWTLWLLYDVAYRYASRIPDPAVSLKCIDWYEGWAVCETPGGREVNIRKGHYSICPPDVQRELDREDGIIP